MPEKQEKKNNGAGKFILGAAIGAALGAIASKFIKLEKDEGEELVETKDSPTKSVKQESKKEDKASSKPKKSLENEAKTQ